jgi:hypothetical protein
VCLVNRKEAENKEEIRAARSPRGFSNLDFKNEGSKSAQSHLINEIETDSIDLSRLDQTFPKDVIDTIEELLKQYPAPTHLRIDNGPELIAHVS